MKLIGLIIFIATFGATESFCQIVDVSPMEDYYKNNKMYQFLIAESTKDKDLVFVYESGVKHEVVRPFGFTEINEFSGYQCEGEGMVFQHETTSEGRFYLLLSTSPCGAGGRYKNDEVLDYAYGDIDPIISIYEYDGQSVEDSISPERLLFQATKK